MARALREYTIPSIRSENYQPDPRYGPQLNGLGTEGLELAGNTAINFKTGATDHVGMVFKHPREANAG